MTSLYILNKYWLKHKKSFATLLFSGTLLCAVITCLFLNFRKDFITDIDDVYDKQGRQTLLVTSDRTDVIDLVTKEDTIRGEIDVLGRTGIGNDTFEYGILHDPEDLAHLPLESGRLPEKEGELAAFRSVLKTFGFFGDVGDKITLDTGTYTLVGILHDEDADYRDGTRMHIQQLYDDVYDENQKEIRYYYPMLFIGGSSSKTPVYTWVMLDNIKYVTVPDINRDRYEKFHDEFNDVLESKGIEFDTERDWRYINWEYYPFWSVAETFKQDQHKMMPLYIVSCMIASLSVLAVMRNIFAERENTIRMLRKIGVSKRRITVMYTIEYICLAIIQAAAGIAIGSAAHFGISSYQTKVLSGKKISGFTANRFADRLLPNSFVIGAAISAGVLLAGYFLAAILSNINAPCRRKKKASSLWHCIGRIFRTRAVTVIQITALTLICFGTVYGYMLFHSTEGYYLENGVGITLENEEDEGKFVPYLVTVFGKNGQFDFDKDDIEEYYCTDGIRTVTTGSFVYSLHSDHFNGIDDTAADKLSGVIPHGALPQTFIVSDKDSKLKSSIVYGSEEEKQFFLDNSSDEGKALLSSDKVLYKSPIALTDKEVTGKLSQYVTAGEINADKLDSGEEILLIVKYGESPLAIGESIQLGAAETENGFGIGKLSTTEVRIGAIITLPKNMDKFLRYSISAGDDYNLLTTASGAASMGFEGAMYTELFAKEAIGSQIPLGTGFNMTSKAQLRHELFMKNASFLGSMGALLLLMSLLGFSAYFNGIGLKIRLKEYQISIMRAIGTPIKHLRRRLMLDGLRIPLFSGAAAFVAVKLMQRIMLSGYNKMQEIEFSTQQAIDAFSSTLENNGEGFTKAQLAQLDHISELEKQSNIIYDQYLCEQQMWFMNAIIPTLIVFCVMCVITILLTRKSFRRFTPDIASSLSKGRKRQ